MSTLQNQLAATEREETARAIRLLLGRPLLLRSADPQEYDLVRRRRLALTRWFDHYLGWTLEVHPRSGYARLYKVAPPSFVDGDARPAQQPRSGVPFDRLRYVFVCVVAAELVRRRFVALGELAEAVAHACAVDTELPTFDTGRYGQRKAFVDALLLLEGAGALIGVEGRTESFTTDEQTAVLYQVEPAALFALLAAPVGASQVAIDPSADAWTTDAVDGILHEQAYGAGHRDLTRLDGDVPAVGDDRAVTAQQNRWLRHSALRAAFDDPALHRDRLSPAQRSYLDSISGREQLRRAAEIAGFVLETRAEGYLLVDADRLATDEIFPADGAASLAALHLLAVLTDPSDPADDGVPRAVLSGGLAALLSANPGWARTYQDEDGADRLLEEALALLTRHHLVRRADDGSITARPAAQRYRDARIERGPARRPAAGAAAETAPVVPLFDEVTPS